MILQALLLALIIQISHTHRSSGSTKEMTDFLLKQMRIQEEMNNTLHYRDWKPPEIDAEYDFVIIGSGSAGSVLANRLSEIPHWNILLLEVGHEPSGFTDIPMLAPAFQFTDLNWGYLMEKQEGVALGMVDQKMAWPRGRALGGSSVINYMLAVRGNKEDYNDWEKMGNPGWSYRDVFKYFLKSEDAYIAVNDTGYHTKGGYLTIEDIPYRTKTADAWVQACQEAGYKYVDYNGRAQIGVSYVQGTTRRGRRCSVEKAFLRPIRDRKNLKILTGARATEILINPDTKEAYGVKYFRNGRYYKVAATKEVISSAGAFNSPQLLMLSGIGPRQHLQELGIPVLQDLPVGQKLYDHLAFPGLTFTVNESIVAYQEDMYTVEAITNFLQGEDILTMLGGVEAFTYMKTNESKDKKRHPDIELIMIGAAMSTDEGALYRKSFRITDEIYNTIWKPLEKTPAFTVLPMLMRPKSHGLLKLKSRSPFDYPKFYGNFFTDPEGSDIRAYIEAIRECQRIVQSPSLQRYAARLHNTPIPGCEHLVFNSDEYWECAIRYLATTLHHQVSTCKMGPSNDPEAVVDHRLRVYGIKRLRVVDTSIIPKPLVAHTNLPTIMVGEKAADIIKEDWYGTGRGKNIDIRHARDYIDETKDQELKKKYLQYIEQ